MIDLHSHILAGIDDGASSLDDSILLIKQSLEQGITHLLATPHIHFGFFDNNLNSIDTAFKQLQKKLDDENIAINIAYAAEVRICPEIQGLIKSEQLPFMGKYNERDVLLLEFPHSHVIPGTDKLIDWLIKQNIQPMIAHPERNRDAWKFANIMAPFKQRGCLMQITAASLLGDFGSHAKKLAWQYVESGDATIIASDMHNLKRRPNKMAEAFIEIKKVYGIKAAEQLFINTAEKIIESNPSLQRVKSTP